MYIELRLDGDNKVVAKVTNNGNGVGSSTTRLTHGPFAVFQVDRFEGLDNIDARSNGHPVR
jgi:hypothetical protein